VALIEKHGWQSGFQAAIKNAQSHDVPSIKGIQVLDDYLAWIDALVTWAPRERGDTRFIYDKLAEFYFFLDQEPVKSLQSPI
jgi:phosphatidylserine decarboxylase